MSENESRSQTYWDLNSLGRVTLKGHEHLPSTNNGDSPILLY